MRKTYCLWGLNTALIQLNCNSLLNRLKQCEVVKFEAIDEEEFQDEFQDDYGVNPFVFGLKQKH